MRDKRNINEDIEKEEKRKKTRNEERVGAVHLIISRFILYTNYKVVVSDYCQPHHTKRPPMHSARSR